jgi:hypothetical protein
MCFLYYGDWPIVSLWIGEAQHLLQQWPGGGIVQHTHSIHMGPLSTTAHQSKINVNYHRKPYNIWCDHDQLIESFNCI